MDKVIDIEERIPTLRERRKKRTNRKFVALLFVFLTLLIVLIYSQSPYSEIQSFNVNGSVLYDGNFYIETSGLALGESMWSFDEDEVEERLSSLEWVKDVSVQKNWPTAVDIQVEEYEGVGYLDQETSYQKVLSNGYAVELPVNIIDGPIFVNFDKKEDRQFLVAQLERLDSEVNNLISQVILTHKENDTTYVTLYMVDGNEVQGILNTLAEKLSYYPSVIAQLPEGQKGVIDMEVGIFFQSYDDVYSSSEEGVIDEESEGE